MSMENENVQQPSYEQLVQAYTALARNFEQTKNELETLKTDMLLNRLRALIQIMEHNTCYSPKLIKLAEWHIEQILAKPKA